jgi:hypothetical protein
MEFGLRHLACLTAIIIITGLILYHLFTVDSINTESESSEINNQFFIMSLIILIIIEVAVFIGIIDLQQKMKKRTRPFEECIICLKDIPNGNEIFCENWISETGRCGDGPFCSKKCLKLHLRREIHEHILGNGLGNLG